MCTAGDRGRRQRLQHEVAIRDRIQRIGHRPVEAERLGGGMAVDRERGSGQRGGPSGDSFSRLRASAKRPRSRAAIST
jgi:hypothetical protein